MARRKPFRFDRKGRGAAQRHAAKMVVKITNETRAAIRALISRSIREGMPPREAARAITAMVGLDRRSAMAAMDLRAELVDKGLPQARVDMITDRFVRKKLRKRAMAVARTETLSALSEGQRLSWQQARDEGLISEDERREMELRA